MVMSRWCQVTVLGRDGSPIAGWTLGGPGPPDLSVVEMLARLALATRRQGHDLILTEICPDLGGLLDLAGLAGELTGRRREPTGRRRKVIGQLKRWKDALGIEEAMEADDPPP
jgi:hypothetical protein